MLNPRLASRYAKSLIDLATEKNTVAEVLKDMQLVDQTTAASRELDLVLKSPVINGDKKISVLNAIFGAQLSPLTMAFMKLMVEKGRESALAEIAAAFQDQYRERNNVKKVKLTSAAPLTASAREKIMKMVEAGLKGKSVQLETAVNPDLIGGFVVEMEDKLFDASIRKDLNDVKKQFEQNTFVSKLR